MCRILHTLFCLVVGLATATATQGLASRHDNSFQPDHILRVTAQSYSQACMERYSVLVNGSSPGPELRLQEGRVSWIRVYNDMEGLNTTMVPSGLSLPGYTITLTVMKALAWSFCFYRTLLRRCPHGQPMAYRPRPLLRLRSPS